MNHESENDLFARLEADFANEGAVDQVVDLDKPTPPAGAGAGAGSASASVDGPVPAGPGVLERARKAKRHPVLPAWAKSTPEFVAAAGWLAGHVGHTGAYHGVRTPFYLGRLACRGPVGCCRIVGGFARWVNDSESEPLRVAAARREDAREYLQLARKRDDRVRARVIVAVLAGAVGLGATIVLLVVAPWSVLAMAAVGLVACGARGGAPDQPLVSPAVVPQYVERLTSHVVTRALGSLGIGEVNKALAKGGEGVKFPSPITREGPGWRADVDLPHGVTVSDIVERRDRLASGLRRTLGCVWPEDAPEEHAGRMVLWVGDQDMAKTPPAEWPLTADTEPVSLFDAVPYGTDQRGRQVTVSLMYANLLIGAMPGMGKTFALRVLALAAALDTTAQLLVYELKGTGDLDATDKVAHDYASGPDDETIERAMDGLRYVHGELERRAKVIRGLPKQQCPENKVTAELAATKSLGLHPLVLVIDECQEVFSHSKFKDEAAELATGIIKRGRALGVILLLATQRPDSNSLPTGVSSNVGIRFCLRVMGQTENDMVLGTSSYKNGIRATTFTAKDRGIGYLVGAGPDPQVTRSYYINNPTADEICDRARAARHAAGTLTGHAAGENSTSPTTNARQVLDDLLTVMPATEDKAWNETLVDRLADHRPDTYGQWGGDQLTAALKPFGITTAQIARRVDGKTINRRGITRHQVAEAVAHRDQNGGAH